MADIYGQLVKAQLEHSTSDLSNVTGLIYYKSDSAIVKYYDGTAWRTVVNTDSTQTLSGKTLTSPVVNSGEIDNSWVDGYLDFAEEAAPATPASGYGRLYATTTGKLKYVNDDGITVEMGSSGGVGEKTYVTNPSGVSDVAGAVPTGWANVGDLDIVVTKTAADLPREYTTAAGLKITADANTQSTADYVYHDFTLDDVDLNKKLKIQWSQKTTGTYNAGDLAVVITTQADRTTALHTPVTTAIPAADGVFITSFDSGSTATLSLVIRATTDMTTDGGIVISDVVVGPGTQPQGAVVTDWRSYTPTGSWVANTTYTGRWRRVGDSMECDVSAATSGAPTSATLTFSIPSGYTIDTTKLASTVYTLGSGRAIDAGSRSYPCIVTNNNTTTVTLVCAETTGDATSLVTEDNPLTFGAGDYVTARFTVPIAEWAGSGTLNVAQNDVEWAADDGSSDVFGPNGALVPNEAAAVSTSTRVFTFQTTPQAGDQYVLELKPSGYNWQNAVDKYPFSGGTNSNSNNYYGVRGYWSSATQYTVEFGLRGTRVSASNVDNGTTSWATEYAAGTRFRVRKASAGAAVGFGTATLTSLGLVKPSFTANNTTQESYSSSSGLVRSGTYTPTYSSTVNLDSTPTSSADALIWMQVGRVVTCSGYVQVDPTAGAPTASEARFTLPVVPTSNFSTGFEAFGTVMFAGSSTSTTAGYVDAVSGTKLARIVFPANATSSGRGVIFTFQYVTN